MKTTIDQYWSDYYDDQLDFMPATTAEVERIFEFLPAKRSKTRPTAIDIGCGTGQLTRELWHRGFRVLGVDASTSAIKLARKATVISDSDLRYVHCDIERQPPNRTLPYAPYDLVTCRLVYAFIKKKGAFIRSVSDILAPGGAFVVVSPLPEHVPDDKASIATDPDLTKAALEEHFEVKFERSHGLGTYVCLARRQSE